MGNFVFFILTCLAVLPSGLCSSRIIGGSETTIEKRPYMASVQVYFGVNYLHYCGASIISTRHLLSAAHCYPNPTGLAGLFARVGSTEYNRTGQVSKIGSFQIHPDFNNDTLDYDFAILTVLQGQEFILGPGVAVIQLTNNNNPNDGSLVTVSGWGFTDESSDAVSFKLQEIDLPVYNQDRCRGIYSFLTSRQICIGGTPQGGAGACLGDSGGPAVQNGVQYAVVAGGNSCSDANIPWIYGRISAVRSWISDLTGV